MMNFTMSKSLRLSYAFVALCVLSVSGFAQSVYTRPSTPQPSPTPFIKPIVKVQPPQPATNTAPAQRSSQPVGTTPNPSANAVAPDIVNPSFEPYVAGMRGILVETQTGQLVMESLSNTPFNPASNIKLATALAVMKNLKPNHRFKTQLYTDGVVNKETGTIEGNLILVGNDPSLNYEHAMMIADALNKMGIRRVSGDLIVSPLFTMNYNPSALRSGVAFYDTMDAMRRSAAAVRSWQNHLAAKNLANAPQSIPSVSVMGAVTTNNMPVNLRLVATHESSPLKDILKICLSYSNNFLAERLGDAVGGVFGVQRIVLETAQIPFEEFQIVTASGLGVNRVTPRAMMKIFRALHNELAKHKMSPTDIMPVAGIDEGTLKNRFTDFRSRASVIGKTGTLPNSDGGVSSLVGQMGTASGEVLFFVIFNQRGNVNRFRSYQNEFVTYLQNQRGGAAPFAYLPKSFSTLLANSRVETEN